MIGWKNLSTKDYVCDNGVYLLRVQDIKNGYVEITTDTAMVSKDKVKEQPQIQLKQHDIVFSKDGSLGFSAVISEKLNNYKLCTGSTLARIRLKKQINPHYLSYILNSDIIKAQISYYLSGIAQPHINQEFIKLLEIPLLPVEVQRFMGEYLYLYEEYMFKSIELIKDAKKDIEELIEGKFDESKISEGV